MNENQKTVYEIAKLGFINAAVMYLPLLMMLFNIGGMYGDTSLAALSLNLLNPLCIVITSAYFGRKMGMSKWYFSLVVGALFMPMVMMSLAPLFYLLAYVGISAICVLVLGAIKKRKERYGNTGIK